MRSWALTLALALTVAVPAWAVTVTSDASGRWTTIADTTAWNAAVPAAGDDFVVASGHKVVVDGTVTVTTGSVTVQSGGELYIVPGATLQPGDRLVIQDGARFSAPGNLLATCRVAAEPTWTADPPTFTLDCPADTYADATDFFVVADEDPADGRFDKGVIQVGAGYVPGALRASVNRWAWYDITAFPTTYSVTADLDYGTYAGGGDAPFIGTRSNDTTTAIPSQTAGAGLSFTVQPGRRATQVNVAAAYGSVVVRHGDRGGRYLYFPQSVANATDPTYCSELQAKVLHTEDGAAGDDILYVAGDVSGCTNATGRLTTGIRRGDLVHLVRPATIDGDVGGTHTSWVGIESGSTLNVKWTRFTRLGAASSTADFAPDLNRHCNICFSQSSTSPGSTISGRFEDVDISFPEAEANDVAVLSFQSMADATPPGVDYRYPNTGLLDMGGLTIRRISVHDSRDAAVGGGAGGHGTYVDAVKNLVVDGERIERISDDLIGGIAAGNESGTATDANSATFKRIVAYEGLAEDNNSQQCIEFQLVNHTPTGGSHNYVRNAGAFKLEDAIGIGCYFETLAYSGTGMLFNRVVNGGHFVADSNGPGLLISLVTGTGVTLDSVAPNRFTNSLLTTYAEDGTSAVRHTLVTAELANTVLWGDEQSADAGNQHLAAQGCRESFEYHSGGTLNAFDGSAADNTFRSRVEWTDCILQSATATRFGNNFNTGGTAYTAVFSRSRYDQTAQWEATVGPMGQMTTVSGAVTNIDGLVLNTATASTKDFDVTAATGSVANVCMESNAVAATVFQTYASSTNVTVPDIFPDLAVGAPLGLLTGKPSTIDVCENAAPRYVGLREVGMAHVMLGDFAVMQMYPVYTSNPNLIQTVGDNTIPSCNGRWPCQ